ncbi:MAG: aldehyde dehydrogenase family protein, partial [Alphaproteobacteria bacterium]|nr:aldehyde dehydrogenase family protein [Alphaproteobacteria bacterium]
MTRDFNGLLRQTCLIDGKWIGEPRLAIRNPATGVELGLVPDFGAAETSRAIAAAQKAFGPWSARVAKDRSTVLKRFAELIVARADDLAALLTAEQGKPLAEARGEVAAAAGYIEFFAEEARRVNGEIIPAHRADSRILVMRQPLGVVS